MREEEPRQLSPRNIRNRNSKAEELLRTIRNMKEDDMRPDEEEGSAVDKTAASRSGHAASAEGTGTAWPGTVKLTIRPGTGTEIIRSGGILTI